MRRDIEGSLTIGIAIIKDSPGIGLSASDSATKNGSGASPSVLIADTQFWI